MITYLNQMHSVILQYAQQLVTVTAIQYIYRQTYNKNLAYNFNVH